MRAPTSSATLPVGGLVLAAALLPGQMGCKSCKTDTNISPTQVTDSGTTATETPVWDHDWGQWLSMDVMQDGSPALAYYDRTKGALGFAIADLSTDPVTWTHEEADGYADDQGLDVGDRGRYASLAIAGDGTAWIAYQDIKLETLRWARRDPATGTWQNDTADGGAEPSGNAGFFASLALDSTSSPVIVHHDQNSGALRLSRWDGSAFTSSVIDAGEATKDINGETVAADVGEFAHIEIADGVEYIAYYDRAQGNLKLAWGTADNYTIEVVDDGGGDVQLDGGGDVGQWPDILVYNGELWISYHDVGNQDLLLAHGTPGNWQIDAVDTGEFVGADTAIFLNGTQPGIAYFDGRNNDMKLATLVGDAWQSQTITGDQGALGFHNEVVLAQGNYYLACYDYTNRTVFFDKL
ncbi:MAG: hypothetical protein GXP62_15370 [Oligoflexia bacterium]|nr:hypothetical protein [Oligoflexia bacterium]